MTDDAMRKPLRYSVAVLGATGTVGREILNLLIERDFPLSKVFTLATNKIPGRQISFGEDKVLPVLDASTFDFSQVDFVLASAGAQASREYGVKISDSGVFYIDNSSAFRLELSVPLMVPEVNPLVLEMLQYQKIIASPNCIAIPLTMTLKPLYNLGRPRRVVVSTYQSVSGAGHNAMRELISQTKGSLMGLPSRPQHLPHPIAFNLFPHIGTFDAQGHTSEEIKIIQESRKILNSSLDIAVTSVRVPTFNGHALSIMVEFEREIPLDKIRKALKKAPGVTFLDGGNQESYTTPLNCAKQDSVFVGRLRKDPSCSKAIMMWVVTDNLRKGAALNMIQIAEMLIKTLYKKRRIH